MPKYTTSNIRNLTLVGHGGAGKTMLCEALLRTAGVISKAGSIAGGDTVSDFTEEEKHHGHSLANAIMHLDHAGIHINLVDTPGFADFAPAAFAALPAVETAAVVINASAGIEPVARRMMERLAERKQCRMIIVNRIDEAQADLPALLAQIKESFGEICLPVNLPTGDRSGVIDCFAATQGDSELGAVADFHTAIVDQVVEVDEELMSVYLEQGEVAPEQLHEAFEEALRQGHLVPICFTSVADPENPVGVAELLHFLEHYAPSPKEGNPQPFHRPGGGNADDKLLPTYEADDPLIAHVFKVRADPFVGKLAVVRVHQGRVKPQDQVHVSNPWGGESSKPFKLSHIFKLQGEKHVEVDEAIPGDMFAVAKLEQLHYNSVLLDSTDLDGLRVVEAQIPEPMFGLAIESASRGDEQKVAAGLHKIDEEDPTFRFERDPTTGEAVMRGAGEMHLRIVLEKLRQRYHVEVQTKPPKIAYRETITAKADGHHRHKKQTGGAGQFGEVFLRVEPLEAGTGFEFVNETFGGSIPAQFLPAIEKGVRQVLETGAVAGYPLQDVRVAVYDGKHHPVDSKEVAFITAGKRAFIDAVQKASPVLLEPCVAIDVTVPQQHMGDITSDLSGKRGRIQATDTLPGDMTLIRAIVPLAEVTQYQSQLKSMTAGQGSFAMEFSHYEPTPAHVQQQIIAEFQPVEEED